jgi:hypothetical protein
LLSQHRPRDQVLHKAVSSILTKYTPEDGTFKHSQ